MKTSTALYCAASFCACLLSCVGASATTPESEVPTTIAQRFANGESPLRFVPGLEEPLVPTGPTTASDDEGLTRAIERFREVAGAPGDFAQHAAPFEDFLRSHPGTPWSTAILTNLGIGYYHAGYFSRALNAWEQAWEAGRSATRPKARAVTDRAVGELARMHARVGHAAELEKLFSEVGDRPISGAATEMFTGAREGLWMFKHEPGKSYLCGPQALKNLLISLDADLPAIRAADRAESGPHGFSLDQVGKLASKVRLSHGLIFRDVGQPIPVPSVVNWKMHHYAAIVGEENGAYHIKDPTFGGGDLWVSKAAIDSESTGYFLIPTQRLPASAWRTVNTNEAKRVFGMGVTYSNQSGAEQGEDQHLNQNNSSGNQNNASSTSGNTWPVPQPLGPKPSCGMCQVDASLMLVSLNINDQPVGYAPQKGPPVFIRLSYNQREANQPANFSFFNVSPKWTINVLSYVQDDPSTNPGWYVSRYVAGGGFVDYTHDYAYNSATGQFSPDRQGQAVLTRIPATGPASSYELRQRDGSKLVYGLPDGATNFPRRLFVTQMVDPAGNALIFHYDGLFRLTSITDATNRNTTFTYGAADQRLVTRITDPFGRHADLTYDPNGRLSSIKDVVGLTSSVTYDSSGLVNSLTTPYGTSHFAYGDGSNISRFLEITDPLGYTERIEFAHQAPGIPYSEPVVPAIGSNNEYVYFRNTFVWDKHLYPITHTDYTKAKIYHWLHNPANQTSPILESTKAPLENRVWNVYPDQWSTVHEGSAGTPLAIGRVLDDGTTQAVHFTYNPLGLKLSATDPVGRQTLYTYDNSNNIDLLTVQQKTSDTQNSTIASFTYNGQHLPLTWTDASGATTHYSYNAAGQLTGITNALNQTTSIGYDTLGRLATVTNANEAIQGSLTYDSADRVRTRTDSEGYVLTYDYDNLDRVTQITYPDGTSTKYVYDKLDLASVTDRLGRKTSYGYNANRELISVTDPQNFITRYAYYENGTLKSLTDAKGNLTRWDIDIQSRPTVRNYPDGKTESYVYESTTSRLKSRTDALSQVKTYAYAADDRVRSIQYSGAVNTTPNVAFTYDPYFPRLTGFADGIGTTGLTYHPVGASGALKLASENGPYAANDTISYAYDVLGRVRARTIDSATESYDYDAISRLAQHTNELGTFWYTYLGQTGQLTNSWLLPGGIATSYQYDTNTNDRRLLAINNSSATDLFLSFGFTSTPEKRITAMSMFETSGSGGSHLRGWAFGYDDDDRLQTANLTDTGGSTAYAYTYDTVGNITNFSLPAGSTAATYNNRNQLTAFGSKAYLYDANGNLQNDGVRKYAWDGENRLISTSLIADIGSIVQFKYDGVGRRLSADPDRIFASGFEGNLNASHGRASRTRYLWCGGEICQARNFADAVTRRYFAEGESHIDSGKGLVYVRDQLGSVRDTLNASTGGRVDSFDYDPYGNFISVSTQTDAPDKLYAGMLYHSGSGLYLTRYREYDSSIGRWISEDPIGLAGGINRYAYVNGNPLSWIDSTGLYADVKVNGKKVTITLPIEYQGLGATPEVISKFNQAIQETWSGQFGDYSVETIVTTPASCSSRNQNTILVPIGNGIDPAYVNTVGRNTGAWPSDRPGWTAAHEAGHLMGLPDYYDTGTGVPFPGHANDIMGARNMAPSVRDIADIIKANP